jgi:hypothetical protein
MSRAAATRSRRVPGSEITNPGPATAILAAALDGSAPAPPSARAALHFIRSFAEKSR